MFNTVKLPNYITLSRIPLLFVIIGLMFVPFKGAALLAFLLYILAGVTDWLDGFLARRYNMISTFGTLMDALSDKIFTLGLLFTFLGTQVLPLWTLPFLILILTREFLITGLRLVASSRGVVLAAERGGKIKSVLQTVSLGFFLVVWIMQKDTWLYPFTAGMESFFYEGGLVVFLVATFVTVSSGLGYIYKYRDLLTQSL